MLTRPILESPGDAPFVGEAPVADGTVQVRTAALDAFRVSSSRD